MPQLKEARSPRFKEVTVRATLFGALLLKETVTMKTFVGSVAVGLDTAGTFVVGTSSHRVGMRILGLLKTPWMQG